MKNKYLIWYIENNQYIFELINNINKPYIYKWLISKEGFTINMIGNISELWNNDVKVLLAGEKMNLSFDNVNYRKYFNDINTPELIIYKKQIIEHIDKILENWI